MKKVVAFIGVFIMLFQGVWAEEIGVSAVAAAVIDLDSQKLLYGKNEDKKCGMASTTKIMTAIVALEEGTPKDMVKISSHASRVEGSSMYLKEGEEISLENLVYGLMLISGNDAATAIAEHIAGSEEKFADLMNKKAKEIGVKNTHFTNPHGLSDDEHYTTASDLAKIAAYGLKNPDFAEIVSTKTKTINRQDLGNVVLVNHNKLLKTYDGCIGVKTGFTKATGRCLVSAARRNGLGLVCVTLNAGDDWNDHKRLLDYAFERYRLVLYKRSGTRAGTVKVLGGETKEIGGIFDEDIYIPEEMREEWSLKIELPKKINAPIKAGQEIGKAIAISKDGERKTVAVIAESDINEKEIKKDIGFGDNLKSVYGKWLRVFAQWKL